MIALGERPLTLSDVVAVARAPGASTRGGGAPPIVFGEAARARVRKSRAVVEGALSAEKVVYGVTTGFGELKNHRIKTEQVQTLQLNLLRSHAAGVGAPAPRDVVRAMLLLRAASLARGYSGCRPDVIDALLALLEQDVTPHRPARGLGRRIGRSRAARASGAGAGRRGRGDGSATQRMPAALALRGAGLQPLTLEAKEGLALINGTQLSTALAVLACADAMAVWEAAVAAAALSIEVLLGSFQPARAATSSACAPIPARPRPRGGCAPTRTTARSSPRTPAAVGCRTPTVCAACRRCWGRRGTRSAGWRASSRSSSTRSTTTRSCSPTRTTS